MAPLRIPSGDFFTNDVSEFFNFSTQHPNHETRHGRHRNHSHPHHSKNHIVDVLSNSIMEVISTKFVPENSVLPDLEPLSSHLDMDRHHPLKMNITMNRSDFGVINEEVMYRHNGIMTAVYCAAYLLVFVVGLIGNCFVIAVVYRSPRMRTVTNFFIVNLAFADILVIVFCLPATLMSNIFVPWVLGWLMCKTVPYVQGLSVAASVYSLVAVSLDRPGWSLNPFWEDELLDDSSRATDEPSSSSVQPTPSTSKKATEKKPAKKCAPKKPKAPAASQVKEISALDSCSESEDDVIPCAQSPPVKRKRPAQVLESEDEAQQDKFQKPVRAARLRSFLTQRSASGFTTQRDPTKTGEYFVELRVYNSREAERLPAEERWKNALTTLKVATDVNTPLWAAVSKLVQAGKQDFVKIQPIMYPSQ